MFQIHFDLEYRRVDRLDKKFPQWESRFIFICESKSETIFWSFQGWIAAVNLLPWYYRAVAVEPRGSTAPVPRTLRHYHDSFQITLR